MIAYAYGLCRRLFVRNSVLFTRPGTISSHRACFARNRLVSDKSLRSALRVLIVVLMVQALVRPPTHIDILGCDFVQFEKHELYRNVLQEVLGEIVRLEVIDSISWHMVDPVVAQECTQRVAAGGGILCEARRHMFWDLACFGNELD